MARKLNAKQIALLKKFPNIIDTNDLPEYVQAELQKLNDYETVWMDANRFLGDEYSKNQMNKGW